MVVLCSVEVVLVAQDVLEFEYFRSKRSVRRFSTTKIGYFATLQLGEVGQTKQQSIYGKAIGKLESISWGHPEATLWLRSCHSI